jgi:hypothetical protein
MPVIIITQRLLHLFYYLEVPCKGFKPRAREAAEEGWSENEVLAVVGWFVGWFVEGPARGCGAPRTFEIIKINK